MLAGGGWRCAARSRRSRRRCARISGGIVLKSDSLDAGQWLAALGEALADEASRSQTTRQALERLLNQ